MYAVIDIETTGGYVNNNRIIEIAIFVFDGEKIIDSFSTLINPEKQIPTKISSLTGITTRMVSGAPSFNQVAADIERLTKDKVFVAHNVGFDYSFIRKEFKALGKRFLRKKLCTVRLSRQILPGLPSYGLGALCHQLGIKVKNRHRAAGDARATVSVLKILLQKDSEQLIPSALNRNSREGILPPNLVRKDFEDLPEDTGVYYFLTKKGEVIYVGKAKNIRDRVISHFTSVTKRQHELKEQIVNISFELTGDELIALLLESHEIKKLKPRFNRAQRWNTRSYGIYKYPDSKGYVRLVYNRVTPAEEPLMVFPRFQDGWNILLNKIREFNLCPKLCGIHQSNEACFDRQTGQCQGACIGKEDPDKYNERVELAVNSLADSNRNYLILGSGRNWDESSIVSVEKGQYQGFGYIHDSIQETSLESLKSCITRYRDTQDAQRIINGYLRKYPRVRILKF